jgi:hypothetical protein
VNISLLNVYITQIYSGFEILNIGERCLLGVFTEIGDDTICINVFIFYLFGMRFGIEREK